MQMNPYLMFNGQCEAAFKFYEQCLNGKIVALMTHADAPAEQQGTPEWRDKIMHARLIAGDAVLMGSDCPPEYFEAPKGFYVSFGVSTPEEAERVFEGLAEGGTVEMPMEETFWAVRFGMVKDKFNTPWMISCDRAA